MEPNSVSPKMRLKGSEVSEGKLENVSDVADNVEENMSIQENKLLKPCSIWTVSTTWNSNGWSGNQRRFISGLAFEVQQKWSLP